MRSIKEILASASPEVIKKLKEILESKDDNKLKEYLDSLIDKTSEKKVESKVKKEVKAVINGIYIMAVKGPRGNTEVQEEPKKGFFAKFKKDK